MDPIWNELSLTIPPLKTITATNINFVKHVRPIILKTQSPKNKALQDDISTNAALLSRLMARRRNSFHGMYGFKCVCKLNAALSRLLKVDLEQSLNNLLQMLPEVINSNGQHELPTKSSYEYILLRIIAIHKLYKRISFYCVESAEYFGKMLTNNYFLETNVLFIAVIAKLWNLSNKLADFYSDFYKKMYQFRNSFPQTKTASDYFSFEFPDHLDHSSESIEKVSLETEHQETNQKTPAITFAISSSKKVEDIGMAISRDSLKPVIDLTRIHNIDDIRRYFKEENEKRKKSFSTCGTKYILNHEWLNIQKLVERKIIANDHKKALRVFRKFMTSKM